MSKKTELISALMEYKGKYESVYEKAAKIHRSADYTETGKQQAINRMVEDFAPVVQNYQDKIVKMIDKGLEDLAAKWKKQSAGRLFDANYQTGLSNVMKMLELGALSSKEDINNIITTYADDYNAIAAIKTILKQKSDPAYLDCAAMIPADNREKNRKLLEQLRSSVVNHINTYQAEGTFKAANSVTDMYSVSLVVESMIDFVRDRLDNELALIPDEQWQS